MTILQGQSQQLENRMLDFSAAVIGVIRQLPKSTENEILGRQLIRSSSSIGANYSEAINAASRIDFRNKIFIAKKEAAETRYWLRLLQSINNTQIDTHLLDESSQLIFILQKIVSTLKNGK